MIKQQMQYRGAHEIGRVVREVIREYGVRGLFKGYAATLMRNIPSAVLRFTIYEELKHVFVLENKREKKTSGFNWKLFASGATAGAISSGLSKFVVKDKCVWCFVTHKHGSSTFLLVIFLVASTVTPVDVIKTRMATGIDANIAGCVRHVIKENGVTGLYMGAGTRIIWSTVFAAIGFGMLETAKGWLGVSDVVVAEATAPVDDLLGKVKEFKMFSRHQRTLEHAVSDKYE